MAKRPLAIQLGITGDLAFAAGCLLQALHRHSPGLDADILLYTDGTIPPKDGALLRDLGARLIPYARPEADLPPDAVRRLSFLCMAKLEGFRLLAEYACVIWLDVDTAVQDDISPLAGYGPFSLAFEDPHFTEAGVTSPASINVSAPCEGLNPAEPNRNTGVMVLRDTLENPEALYRRCRDWVGRYGPYLTYLDQAVLNMLAQTVCRETPQQFTPLPHDLYNAHPRNPAAQRAAIVHAFGAYKLWDDGLTRCSFPEWERDYLRWLAKGGTPWQGTVDNEEFLDGGAFHMLTRMYNAAALAEEAACAARKELARERALRSRLEKILETVSDGPRP